MITWHIPCWPKYMEVCRPATQLIKCHEIQPDPTFIQCQHPFADRLAYQALHTVIGSCSHRFRMPLRASTKRMNVLGIGCNSCPEKDCSPQSKNV